MRRLGRVLAAMTGVLVVGVGCSSPASSPTSGSSATSSSERTSSATTSGSPVSAASFDDWVRAEMKHDEIPGLSVAVVRDYEIAEAKGYGLSDTAANRPVTPDTLFQAASVSKAISAIAMMIGYGQKGASIEKPLAALTFDNGAQRWELPNPQHFTISVTPRLLLSHRGGTNTFHYSGYRQGGPIPTMLQELRGEPPATTAAIQVLREPGQTWDYSPAGFTVMQEEVEQLYQRPFHDVMDELLIKPLGLTESTFEQPTPAAIAGKMATPYLTGGQPSPNGPLVFNTTASGGMVTTPSDLARIMIAFQKSLDGKANPIPTAIAEQMMVRQPGATEPGHCFPITGSDKKACQTSWGLGFDVNLTAAFDHVADGQSTGNWFGHSGFNTGYLTIFVGSKSGGNGYVLMVNISSEDMNGTPPQFEFMVKVAQRIAADQGWS